jgi:hypothetical protein
MSTMCLVTSKPVGTSRRATFKQDVCGTMSPVKWRSNLRKNVRPLWLPSDDYDQDEGARPPDEAKETSLVLEVKWTCLRLF